MNISVVILDYERSSNLVDIILPILSTYKCVYNIIVLHGKNAIPFGYNLKDGERIVCKNVIHIADYYNNVKYRCFRRWRAIQKLYSENIIGKYVLVVDDDILLEERSILSLRDIFTQQNALAVTHSCGGRNIYKDGYKYNNIKGICDLIIGQCIFTIPEIIKLAVEWIETVCDDPKILLYEDDISMCFGMKHVSTKKFISVESAKYFKLLPSPNAISLRPTHLEKRTNAILYWSKYF